MRILVNVDHHNGGYSVHCIGSDNRTQISPWLTIKSGETLIRLIAKLNPLPRASEDKTHEDALRTWQRTSVQCEPDAGGLRLLRIH